MRKNAPYFKLSAGVAIGLLSGLSPVYSQEKDNESEGEFPDTINQGGEAVVSGDSETLDEVFELEGFIVTGTLIPRTEVAGEAIPIPVDIVTAEDIQASGASTAAELLQALTVNNGGSVPLANNATGFTPSASSVSLRGLGPSSTLVLLNGRRLATFPTGNGGTGAFVDLNSLPLGAVERFEVLKDGAAATYGADAVAGVINIVLKTDYVGTQTTLRYGNTTAETDSSEFTANLMTGFSTEKSEFTFGANYSSRKPIFARDRDYSRDPRSPSINSSTGNYEVSAEAAIEALMRPVAEGGAGLSGLQARGRVVGNNLDNLFSEARALAALRGVRGYTDEILELLIPLGLEVTEDEVEGLSETELTSILTQRINFLAQQVSFNYGSLDPALGSVRTNSAPADWFGDLQPIFDGEVADISANDGTVGPGDYYYYIGDIGQFVDSRYNASEFAGAFPEIERKGAFINVKHRIGNLDVYGDLIFQQVEVRSELAPAASGAFYTASRIPIVIPGRTDDPFRHVDQDTRFGGNRPAAPGAFNRFNPFNYDLTGSSNLRFHEFGNRVIENVNNAINTTIGAKASKVGDWNMIHQEDMARNYAWADDLLNEMSEVDYNVRWSPVYHVGKITKPLMILHGGLDNRVNVNQARRFRDALNDAGIEHEYHETRWMVHGFLEQGGREMLDYYTRIASFFVEHLE